MSDTQEWVPWGGGRCPLTAGSVCDTQHRDGSLVYGRPVYANEIWDHFGTPCDIVAYRAALKERNDE
jgi:hypothetical protein